MSSNEVFIHIPQGCFAGTGAIVRLPQCQWSKPDGYGKISQCITTPKHIEAKTVCIFLGIYCKSRNIRNGHKEVRFISRLRWDIFCLKHISVSSLALVQNELCCRYSSNINFTNKKYTCISAYGSIDQSIGRSACMFLPIHPFLCMSFYRPIWFGWLYHNAVIWSPLFWKYMHFKINSMNTKPSWNCTCLFQFNYVVTLNNYIWYA